MTEANIRHFHSDPAGSLSEVGSDSFDIGKLEYLLLETRRV